MSKNGIGGSVTISGGQSNSQSGGVQIETPGVTNEESSGSVSILTGNIEQGLSGDVFIGTGSMKPKRSIEGRPGDVVVKAGSAGDEDAYHGGQSFYGDRAYGNSNVQSRGGSLSFSSGDSFDGDGGKTTVRSGNGLYRGGRLNITGGFGVRSHGGDLFLSGGNSRDKIGGDVTLAAGSSSSLDNGSILIGGGQGFRKGSISLIGSQAVDGDGADVFIASGASENANTGSVSIESPDSKYGSGEVSMKSGGSAQVSGEE
jgi:hypothetical protein